jgi:hypothetical protein
MSRRAAQTCGHPGCPNEAVTRGRCEDHKRKAWKNGSPSSRKLNSPEGRMPHRRAREAALRRSGGRCEAILPAGKRCWHTKGLQLHHPQPISQHGPVVQADALMLCPACHKQADRDAGARHLALGYKQPLAWPLGGAPEREGEGTERRKPLAVCTAPRLFV